MCVGMCPVHHFHRPHHTVCDRHTGVQRVSARLGLSKRSCVQHQGMPWSQSSARTAAKNGLKLPPTHGPAPNHYISTQHRSSPPPLLAWLLRYEEPFSRQRALMAVPEPALVCLRETVTGRQWSRHARACAHIHFYTHHRLRKGVQDTSRGH